MENADFDTRHTFNAYARCMKSRSSPSTGSFSPGGWQGNMFATFYTGKPVNIKTSTNNSGVGEFQDRAVKIANPYTTSHTLVRSSATAGA